jgi:hypothetical protein
MLHGAEKNEGSFAKEIGDVRGAAALRMTSKSSRALGMTYKSASDAWANPALTGGARVCSASGAGFAPFSWR